MKISIKSNISKSIIAILFMVATSCLYAGYDDVYTQVEPKVVVVGENAEFYLISAAGFPEVAELPSIPGLTWSKEEPSHSTSTRIIKARRISTYRTIYQFSVSHEGTFTIPEMKVQIGHLVKNVPPLQFKAYKRKVIDSTGKEISLDKLLYSSALLMTNRDYIYVGEEVPLEIRMYSLNGLNPQCYWPQLDINNVVMKDYSSINPQAPNFQIPKRKTISQNNQVFNEDIFKTALRPIAPGTLSGKVTIPCLIKIPRAGHQSRDSLDDFFGSSFFESRYENIEYKLKADIEPKKVIALPPTPKNAYYTGLVGEWDLNYSLSTYKLKAGEPVTLKIHLKGKGTLDTLSAPEIKIDGFRIYPPEVKKYPAAGRISQAEIQYAIIPKNSGSTKINITFSTFSPLRKEYILKTFSKEFQVEKGKNISSGMVAGGEENNRSEEKNRTDLQKTKESSSILYLKPEKSGAVKIPLRKNNLLWVILIFILGPGVLIISEILSYKKEKLSRNPLLKRKNSAKKRKNDVIKRIKNAKGEDELHAIIQNDLTPLINDLYGFPPGTSTDELAEKLDNTKLSSCIKAGSSSSYMPGNTKEYNAATLKKQLLKALKRISLIILIFSCSSLYSTENKLHQNDPRTAYDRKDPETAEAIYKSQLAPGTPDPAWLYNIGNCKVQEGDLPQALLYYERARRLAPGDSDILENLNFVRRKLLLPEIGRSKTPLDSLENFRDSFRPDTWMLIIAITWSMCWLSLSLRRVLTRRKWISSLVISLILLICSILAYISQQNSTYNSRYAIVVKQAVPVYMLPSVESEKAGFKLRAGEEVKIEEERHNWLRIRQEHSEGWVHSDSVKRVWPY